jgi:hypothetical protein
MVLVPPVMTGIVAVPDRALLSAVAWAVVALVVGTLVRLALAKRDAARPPIHIVKRPRPPARTAA